MLQKINIPSYTTKNGVRYEDFPLYYRSFGPPLGQAPVILVTHALTGNSLVAGPNGWWNHLVGKGKTIDLNCYTVLCFDIPGNGTGSFFFDDEEGITAEDIAHIFIEGLQVLKIKKLFAGIGGSLGGQLLWQMALASPKLFEHLIPIATHFWKIDWLTAFCHVQKQILKHSAFPLTDARQHAMAFYRNPLAFEEKFQRNDDAQQTKVQNWLKHHGRTLESRFSVKAYRLMNHLLMTAHCEDLLTSLPEISAAIHIINIDSDLLFPIEIIQKDVRKIQAINSGIQFSTLSAPHGHDAFLMPNPQWDALLNPFFKPKNRSYEYSY